MQRKSSTGSKNISKKLRNSVEIVSAPWKGSPYYQEAEKWLPVFWDENTVFRQLFDKLDLSTTVELAVGHGRHAELVAKKSGKLIVMDIFEDNLNVCRQRLSDHSNIMFKQCQGVRFDGVDNGWASSIYCYDAMVHFSPDVIEAYLMDSHRILRTGGKALFHHSNYPSLTNQHYGLNPHARNHMTKKLFFELCEKADIHVLKSTLISWGGVDDLDCVTLVEKR